MGLAASQARLISLTARMSDLEYEGQQINQQRQVLTNKMTEVYNQAMAMEVPTPPSKIDFGHEAYTSTDKNIVFEKGNNGDFIGYKKTTGTGVEPYYADKKESVDAKDIIKQFGVQIEDGTGDCTLTTLQALKLGLIEKDENGKLVSKDKYIITDNNNGTWSISGEAYTKIKKDTVNNDVPLKLADAESYINSLDSKDNLRKNFSEAIESFQKHIGDDFDKDKCQVLISGNEVSFLYEGAPDVAGQMKEGQVLEFKVNKNTPTRVELKNIQPSFDANGNVVKFSYVEGDNPARTVDVEQSGDYYDEPKYEAAMRQYNRDKIEYDQKQNEYNKQTSIYQRQDKQLELKLTRLDNERNALNTEIESVKKVIQDASEKGFKTFSG